MNVFDIIGPVMVGPSSSHTAGACRIGYFVRSLLSEMPKDVTIYLSGSFAKTYKGHGTDRALVGGLMGFLPSDIRIKDSLILAEKEGLKVTFICEDIELAHPNTARIVVKTNNGNVVTVTGSSVGGGSIKINDINGIKIDSDGTKDLFIVNHKDVPGMIAKISAIISRYKININGISLYRNEKGGEAVVIVQVDNDVKDAEVLKELSEVENVSKALLLKAIEV